MTVTERAFGDGVSYIESIPDEVEDSIIGYQRGYAAARRGQLINSTIYRMTKEFRSSYLDGYYSYRSEATRYHRAESISENED